MSQIEAGQKRVEFTREGVKVKEIVEPQLSDGEPKSVIQEEYDWEEFPKDEVYMEVTGMDYKKSEKSQAALKSLEFRIDDISRKERNESSATKSIDGFWKQVEDELDIKYKNEDVELDSSKSGKQNLCDFIRFLSENGHISKDQLPVSTGGYERYILNTEERHRSKSMENAEKVDGIYVETNNPTSKKKEFIKKLGQKFGQESA